MNHTEFEKYATRHLGINSLAMHDYVSSINNRGYVSGIQNMTRAVIEERPTNFREIDVFSRLMMDRIIFLGYPIDTMIANIINAQLLFLQSSDATKDINLYINSPGGSVYDGLSVFDTMHIIQPDVATICTGMAASMGAVLLCAGAKDKRAALKHSRVMIHQPIGGVGGQASDVEIIHKEIQKIKEEIYQILAEKTGQTVEKIWADSDRDFWMRAHEAKEYGLVDEVLGTNLEKA